MLPQAWDQRVTISNDPFTLTQGYTLLTDEWKICLIIGLTREGHTWLHVHFYWHQMETNNDGSKTKRCHTFLEDGACMGEPSHSKQKLIYTNKRLVTQTGNMHSIYTCMDLSMHDIKCERMLTLSWLMPHKTARKAYGWRMLQLYQLMQMEAQKILYSVSEVFHTLQLQIGYIHTYSIIYYCHLSYIKETLNCFNG